IDLTSTGHFLLILTLWFSNAMIFVRDCIEGLFFFLGVRVYRQAGTGTLVWTDTLFLCRCICFSEVRQDRHQTSNAAAHRIELPSRKIERLIATPYGKYESNCKE